MAAAMMIHVSLGERGAKPAKKGAAPGVGRQWRRPLAVDQTKAIELGVK
jgi:hypothetical protein